MAERDHHAVYCPTCDKVYAAVPQPGTTVRVAVDYKQDGFTPSAERHICDPHRRHFITEPPHDVIGGAA